MIDNSIKIKDPASSLYFGFNWAGWLNGDEVITSGSLTTAASGLTITGSYVTSACVIFLASGGEVGKRYPIVCRIATNGSQIEERTMKIDVRNR